MMETIGIVGVGRMGLAMAKHLIRRDYAVVACDIDTAGRDRAAALGASVAQTPADVGRASAFVIVAVGYDDEAKAVTLGPDGVLSTLAKGSIVAVSSTVAPDTVTAIDAAAQARGSAVLDAPICRGRFFADEGKLLALFGGPDDIVERARPIYAAFTSDIAHLGAVGHGQIGKAINNLMLWITSVGLIEAGRIAESTGVDLPTLREALMKSSAASKALEDWDQTSFTWALKDMQIVSQMTDAAGLALPLTGAIKEMVKEARRIKAKNPPQWTGRK
jgi:3-hydroxyisobutyrate dehydrogenase